MAPATKLSEAVAEYSGKTGVNAAAIVAITEKFVGLLASRWEHICDAAHDDENNGKISLSCPIALDFTHKTPVGVICLRFTPQKINDDATFQTPDPDQTEMPLDVSVRAPRRMSRVRAADVAAAEYTPAS